MSFTEKEIKSISGHFKVPVDIVRGMTKMTEEELINVIDAWKRYEATVLKKLNLGEATLLKALESYGYSRKELKALTIRFGDVGLTGEYVVKNKKQHSVDDYF